MLSYRDLFLFVLLISSATYVNAEDSKLIYKCITNNQIAFSQQPCPDNYTQYQIEYQNGLAKETPEKTAEVDPLQKILATKGLTTGQLGRWLDSEINRLQQEHGYLETLRTNELQKLERERYWEHTATTDSGYLQKQQQINQRYDTLQQRNHQSLAKLQQYKQQLPEPQAHP
ncbi:DUF4124 domain-containing protein [Shewanella sp. A32]|uniref:DUF4124 domain-containing protein n=1 Tax=Shewanella sp. A32 TaxID=3031327 RepID=UPI0023B8F089|nr:DUF4124 domain-containing protein [Shewanella sp. A32]MDF0533194.1 DUF4124 domain-containing protein [Shewanella sp. A32]